MIRRAAFPAIPIVCLLLAASEAQDLGTEEQRREGLRLYEKYCSQCHGDQGDGMGVAAPYQKPRPRDFTRGLYKIRSTPTGRLPTDEDLRNVIRNGMPYTAMPAWPQFNERQLQNLVYHLKTFYPGFAEQNPEVVEIPTPPRFSQESAERGRVVYENLGCAQCHGEAGRGDGPSAPTLADDWDYHLKSANFTQPWTFRAGSSRRDIYRTMMTGFSGTPMPAFDDEATLPPDDRWALVDYIYSLSPTQDPQYSTLLTAVPYEGVLDLEEGLSLFESAPMARFPVVGQIMEPGRNFYPSVTSVETRAVYDFESIAILLQWDDMKADVSGSNSPTLPVPRFDPEKEDEALRIPREAQDQFDDLWDDVEEDPFADFEALPETVDIPESEFSDAVAIQFPVRLPRRLERPYFLLGDSQNGVELWFVDLADSRPRLFSARGSDSIEPGDGEPFEVWSTFQEGRWSVVFKRRKSTPRSVSFEEGGFVPLTFSVWDGFNRERGSRRGLTSWFYLYVEPIEKPSPYGPMATNSLAVAAGLILVVFLVRRKYAPGRNSSTPNKQE